MKLMTRCRSAGLVREEVSHPPGFSMFIFFDSAKGARKKITAKILLAPSPLRLILGKQLSFALSLKKVTTTIAVTHVKDSDGFMMNIGVCCCSRHDRHNGDGWVAAHSFDPGSLSKNMTNSCERFRDLVCKPFCMISSRFERAYQQAFATTNAW